MGCKRRCYGGSCDGSHGHLPCSAGCRETDEGCPDSCGDSAYPYTHSIGALAERMSAAGLPKVVDVDDADYLSAFAIGGRYGEEATADEARTAASIAEKLCARLDEMIDEALGKIE